MLSAVMIPFSSTHEIRIDSTLARPFNASIRLPSSYSPSAFCAVCIFRHLFRISST